MGDKENEIFIPKKTKLSFSQKRKLKRISKRLRSLLKKIDIEKLFNKESWDESEWENV